MVSKNFQQHEEISKQRLVFLPASEHHFVGPKKDTDACIWKV